MLAPKTSYKVRDDDVVEVDDRADDDSSNPKVPVLALALLLAVLTLEGALPL
jgi:hypothetical protein